MNRDNIEFYKRAALVALPVALQQLITVGVNMMDSVMLGTLGEVALSSSALANQVFNLFHFITMGLGMGAGVLTARFWGAKDIKNLHKTIAILTRFALIASLIFTIPILLAPDFIVSLFTNEADVIEAGVGYFQYFWPCFILYAFSQTTTIVLRTSKQLNVPLYASIASFFVNIFCNWVFIFGKLGMPRMGVQGAALGTLISRIVETAIICGFFYLKETQVHFRFKDILTPCKDLLPEYVKISFPVLLSDTLLGVGTSMISVVLGHMGKAYLAANSITSVLQMVVTVMSMSLSQSATVIIGNTLGEGKVEESKRQGYLFERMGIFNAFIAFVFILATAKPMVSLYNINAETYAIAMQLMYATAFMSSFMQVSALMTKGVLRAGGDTRFLMVIDIAFIWAISLPLGAWYGIVHHGSAFWVIIFLRLDNAIKCVICAFRLRSGKWIKKIKTSDEK